LRLLLVVEAYLPLTGGGITYEADLVRHFRQMEHTVDIVTVNRTERREVIEQEEGGRVFRLPLLMQFDRAFLSAHFPFWLRSNIANYDLLHFNCPNPIGELAFLYSRIGRPVPPTVCTIHYEIVSERPFNCLYNGRFFPNHLNNMDRIVVSSQNFADTYPLLRPLASKTVVIPFGIDENVFRPPEPDGASNADGPLRLIWVGRAVQFKGLAFLLEALAMVENVSLDIIGEGPVIPGLERQAGLLGVSDRVRFAGHLPYSALPAVYQQADVVVLSSTDRRETFGYVVAEGMASGLAAITTEIGTGTSFVNLDGESGLVVAPRDAAALAGAIRMLAEDRGRLRQYQRQARQRVLRLFTVDRMLEQTAALYRELGVDV
jgi:glycosyltransferase involved in cell wall biosynthesis